VLPVIRHHHELFDGTGYPDHLAGDKIPLLARVLQIADVYDALTTDRPYRRAISHADAVKTLWSEALAGRLDSFLVNRFAETFANVEGLPFAARRRSMAADYYSLPSFEQ
jgi:putative two-component system response regulator